MNENPFEPPQWQSRKKSPCLIPGLTPEKYRATRRLLILQNISMIVPPLLMLIAYGWPDLYLLKIFMGILALISYMAIFLLGAVVILRIAKWLPETKNISRFRCLVETLSVLFLFIPGVGILYFSVLLSPHANEEKTERSP
jgi:hypothetical protein